MKTTIPLPSKLLKAVACACSKDSTRYILQNVQVNFRKGRIVLAASNGRILLAAVVENIKHDLTGQNFLIPSSLIKYIKVSDNDVTVEVDGNYVYLRDIDRNGISVGRKMITGTFPNWKQIIPEGKLVPHSCPICRKSAEIAFSAMSVFKNKSDQIIESYSVDSNPSTPHIFYIEERMFGLFSPSRVDDRKMKVPSWLFDN